MAPVRIMIRFNTEKDKINQELPPWRVIADGKENLAQKVTIKATSWTTRDEVEPGKFKWHITVEGTPHWNATTGECVIT